MDFIKLSFLFATLLIGACSSEQNHEQKWNDTIKQVSSGVVSIQTDVPVSFDGKWNSSGHATGFIVDAKQGLILTNRHVVTPGPVTAKAVLINNEEIDLTPIYIDPVHDFGFYKYQPEQIKHIQPHEFQLDSASAHVGQEIRIIGNDAGQKVSILDGTISRLDRKAPSYGKSRYNDFNTFYIQASTASTGGSSGSPVINIDGKVVALNAGSHTRSANAFYLPLTSVVNALNQLKQNQTINRGSLLTTFVSTPFTELKRLGLTDDLEQEYRQQFPDTKGLLTVTNIMPDSSSARALELGDILLSANAQPLVEFSQLENVLNQNVEQKIQLAILRSGKLVETTVSVTNLADVTPTSFLQFDSSIFHDLSYQQARHLDQPLKGVFVAASNSSFKNAGVPHAAVLTELNGNRINTLEDFVRLTKALQHRDKIHLRFYTSKAPKMSQYTLLEVNKQWFTHSFCQRDLSLGYWPCKDFPTQQRTSAPIEKMAPSMLPRPQHTGMEDALVDVTFFEPYSIQGRSAGASSSSSGLIVDKKKGWVVVDRSVVTSVLGSVKIVINDQLELPGKIEYVHALHNLAIVSYPTDQVGDLPISEAKFASEPLKEGEQVIQMGLNYDGEIEYRPTTVSTIQQAWINGFNVPQFAESNLNLIDLINPNTNIDGVLLNARGEVAALWAFFAEGGKNGKGTNYFSAGLSSDYVLELIKLAEAQQSLYSLNLNLTKITPIKALQRGLPRAWLDKIVEGDAKNHKILMIYQIMSDTPSSALFKRGDIILAIDDSPVFSFKEFERLSQSSEVKVTFFREGKVLEHSIKTSLLSGRDIDSVLFWAGLNLHEPHRAARMQRNIGSEGLYIGSYSYGSPASRYRIFAMRRIVEVDGTLINTKQDFINLVKDKAHGESVKLKTKDFNDKEEVTSLKIDNHYWPFFEMRYQVTEDGKSGEWQKIRH